MFGNIKKMDGNITIQRTLGKGTTFTLYFPQTNQVPRSTKVTGEIPSGNESVLLVDDDVMLGNMLNTMLTTLGYTVTYCSSSIDALQLFEKDREKYDIIITDETMPLLKGSDFARHIREQDENIPIILCSGAIEDTLKDQLNNCVTTVLEKPLKREEIALEIRNCFNDSESKSY